MNIHIPIFVETLPEPDGSKTLFHARPLFFTDPLVKGEHLRRVTSKLAGRLKRRLDDLGQAGSHQELAQYTFYPDVQLQRLELRLELRRLFFHGWFHLVTLNHLSRTLAFAPGIDDLWFEVGRGESVRDRATEVFTRYFRDVQKDRGDNDLRLKLHPYEKKHRAWITPLELNVRTRQDLDRQADELMAFLAGMEKVDGAVELERVGRCLDWLYPDELDRALKRDSLVAQLEELLSAADRRPVLLVGPRMVGKTTLIHEYVHRAVTRRASVHARKRNVWQISPQRLISGMSYVGQWENRLLAILKEAKRRDHVLFFDDVLGLFRAGVVSNSPLSAADVLKPYVERRDVRVLAEMTPESLRVFRERDRGFADMFHVIHVDEPKHQTTIRILLEVVRRLEDRHRCRFAIDVVPTVVELVRRYQREAAFPGKAARWMQQLAVKYQDRDLTRAATFEEFHLKSGLDVSMLDGRSKLPRQELVDSLKSRIIGQQAAVETMADLVAVAKARLNDPGKPLGTLLFLGPTGVGKTQSAKALAGYLLGDPSRMLRFDMNEFVSPESAARLVGTFNQPEGLLTSAIRRQPFAVVLFDEIEKAHGDVFDLMLQILGEARLTDALGRTADFSNAVIILTSNLGSRQAASQLGFSSDDSTVEAVYPKAAEEFFRPEFFNRIDRIVPFARLSRDELRRIAEMILTEVVAREGLRRRKCAVEIDTEATEWMIDRGTDPALGARAMRRAIEREMVRPIAARLAAVGPDRPTVLNVSRRGEQLDVEVAALDNVAPPATTLRPQRLAAADKILTQARAALDRIESACAEHRPAGEVTVGNIAPELYWSLGTAEYLKDVHSLIDRTAQEVERPAHRRTDPRIAAKRPRSKFRRARIRGWDEHIGRQTLATLCVAQDIHEYLSELATSVASESDRDVESSLRHLMDKLALAAMLGPADEGWLPQRVLVVVRSLADTPKLRDRLVQQLTAKFTFHAGQSWKGRFGGGQGEMTFGLDAVRYRHARESDDERLWWETIADPAQRSAWSAKYHLDALEFEGHRAEAFLRNESGTHLFTTGDDRLQPLQVAVLPLCGDDDARNVLLGCLAARENREPSAARSGPFQWRPVIGVHTERQGMVLDLRTGLAAAGERGVSLVQTLMAALALPKEFERWIR